MLWRQKELQLNSSAASATQGETIDGTLSNATVYPSAGLPSDCFPYCGPDEPYAQPFVMVQLTGLHRGRKTAVMCSADAAAVSNVGDTSDMLQQRDRLASTCFAFTIR